VTFREAVAAEALDLLEGALGKVARIAARQHPVHQLVAKRADAAGELESRHRPAERIRLGRREAGADDRHLHRLFLEERDAERLSRARP
jgi:hypothetical protein